MALPDPVPGLVIRYGYLWGREAREGREEGAKDRPCAIVVTAQRAEDGRTRVMVAPITHAPPRGVGQAVEVPLRGGAGAGARRRALLDRHGRGEPVHLAEA